MEYEKIMNLLDDKPNQSSKFKTKNWVEINDQSWGTYSENNQIGFQNSMLRSSLCDYSDSYVLVKGTPNKKVIFRNCVPFTNCISRINNTQVDGAHDIDVVMPTYNLIKYIDNYLKTSGILWQYCRDKSVLTANGDVDDCNTANATTKIKEKITGETGNDGTKNVEIMVPLKYLNNFWSTLEMTLKNCEINLDLNWSKTAV